MRIHGSSEGVPIVGSDGLYSYMVTNSEDKKRASFVIIDNSNGSTVFREDSQSNAVGTRPIAYAPLGVGRTPLRGNWKRGGGNNNDMLIWGELYVEGRWKDDSNGVAQFEGDIHFFQLPLGFNPNLGQNLSTSSSDGRNKTTLSPPLVPSHGMLLTIMTISFR